MVVQKFLEICGGWGQGRLGRGYQGGDIFRLGRYWQFKKVVGISSGLLGKGFQGDMVQGSDCFGYMVDKGWFIVFILLGYWC